MVGSPPVEDYRSRDGIRTRITSPIGRLCSTVKLHASPGGIVLLYSDEALRTIRDLTSIADTRFNYLALCNL